MRKWYEQQQHLNDLVSEKTIAELESLKAQVQPHFIFNTLNNIYSTALKTSPETASLIAHLSSLLNYNLYDARQPLVAIQAELEYLRSYIALQQNRYGETLDVSVNIFDDLTGVTIPPLLILPLVENSFKHGVAASIHGSWFRMDVSRQQDQVVVKIENSINSETGKQQKNGGGLGIKNVIRRLEMIYPNQHVFKTLQEQSSWLVIVKIPI